MYCNYIHIDIDILLLSHIIHYNTIFPYNAFQLFLWVPHTSNWCFTPHRKLITIFILIAEGYKSHLQSDGPASSYGSHLLTVLDGKTPKWETLQSLYLSESIRGVLF